MQKTVSFKKKIIATTIASLAAGMSGVVFAQENNDTIDEVVVTGIKASLTRAMDIKREAAGVVDAISAEDIGKMPDANLAESLQRISGVSIDRANGEGSKVTVRGMSGDYNLVTVNGRQMPASSQANGGASVTRSFDFANLASEGVAGVEVYKTGRADIATGGMGAVINILTPHPLKNPGLKATVGVKAVSDQSSEKNNITPEVSGLFSNTFADDTIGIAVAGSYQERDSGSRQAYTGGWFATKPGVGGDWAGIPAANAPQGSTDLYSTPVNIGYRLDEVSRATTNGQLTLQYKPIDTLTATVDYIYAKKDVDVERHSMGAWFNRGQPLVIQWSDTNPRYPLTYSETNASGATDFDFSASLNQSRNEMKSTGLNLQYEATDNLKVEFDSHHSMSESGPKSNLGTDNGFDVASYTNYNPSVDFRGEFPILHLNPQPGVALNPDPARVQLSGNYFKKGHQVSIVNQQQLKGEYTFDDSLLKAIDLGVTRTEITNVSQWKVVDQQNMGTWGGVDGAAGAGKLPDSLFPTDYMSSHFEATGADSPFFQDGFINFNFRQLLKVGAALYGADVASTANPCVRSYCTAPGYTGTQATDQRAVETSTAGFIQGKFEAEYAGLPMHLLAGLRYEKTDVVAKSLLPVYTHNIAWLGGNEFQMVQDGANQGFFQDKGDYAQLLPSLDYDVNVTDDIKVRASASKTMARPNYNDISGGQSFGTVRSGSGVITSGNPDLDPFTSTNFDLSVEWYYGDASYVSAGYFKKDLKDFIGSGVTTTKDTLSGQYHTVVGGARWNAAIASGIAPTDNIAIKNYILAHTPANDPSVGWTLPNTPIYAVSTDPVLPFDISHPINNQDVSVDGIEISWQHTFDSGFGVLVNGTKVDSDKEYKNDQYGTQFAVLGLSDSANLVVFYDKNDIQARIAYNWRDEFLNAFTDGVSNNPVYVEAYGQIDATASYKLTENLTVSFEGLNITGEHTRSHNRDWHELQNYTETGARYNIGARYTF